MECPVCGAKRPEKGRAFDGRRAYRCASCGNEWTLGMQGRQRQFSSQRIGNQFADTGATSLDPAKWADCFDEAISGSK